MKIKMANVLSPQQKTDETSTPTRLLQSTAHIFPLTETDLRLRFTFSLDHKKQKQKNKLIPDGPLMVKVQVEGPGSRTGWTINN